MNSNAHTIMYSMSSVVHLCGHHHIIANTLSVMRTTADHVSLAFRSHLPSYGCTILYNVSHKIFPTNCHNAFIIMHSY